MDMMMNMVKEEVGSLIETEKLNVFHNMFEKRVVRYADGRNGMFVDTSLEITDGRLVLHYNSLARKYGHMTVEGDLLTEYILQAYNAINMFEVQEGNKLDTWRGIASKTNRLYENKLIKYIKITIEHEIYQYANPDIVKSSKTIDGEKIYYRLKMDVDSLDKVLYGNAEDIEPIQLDDGNRLFGEDQHEYYISYFQEWYNDNRESILTKAQVKLLDDLRTVAKDRELTRETFEEATGVSWNNYRDRLRRIEDRIEKAWRKQNPKKKSRRRVSTTKRDAYIKELLELINNPPKPETQNIEITDMLVEGMNSKYTEEIVFEMTNKAWKGEELILFNRIVKGNNSRRVAIKAPMLMKLVEIVVAEANSLDTEEEEFNLDTVNHIEDNYTLLESNKKETEEEVIDIYDKEGNYLRTDTVKVEKDKTANNIFKVRPDGTWSKINN